MKIAAAVVVAGAPALGAGPYIIDFFPKLPQVNAIQQLVFIGPSQGEITGARLVIECSPRSTGLTRPT